MQRLVGGLPGLGSHPEAVGEVLEDHNDCCSRPLSLEGGVFCCEATEAKVFAPSISSAQGDPLDIDLDAQVSTGRGYLTRLSRCSALKISRSQRRRETGENPSP